jgi:hypothetical protein
MATIQTYPTTTGPVQVAKRILPADTTAIVDVYDNSAGTAAVKFDSLSITTTNSADRVATFYLYSGTTSFRIGSCSVPDLSGSNGTTDPRINVLSTLGVAGADGVPAIWVSAGNKLQVSVDAALATDKVMDVVGRAWTFL